MNFSIDVPIKEEALDSMIKINDSRILIVDDEPANVMLLTRMLEEENYINIYSTTDPREGLSIYKNEAIDLVLLDLLMPHMTGFEVMENMREVEDEHPLPVIVLTAQTDQETLSKSFSAGAADFIAKPLNDFEVFARIENILLSRFYKSAIRNQNQLLEQKVDERTKELVESNKQLRHSKREILKRPGLASEYRDNETGLHVIRMSNYCAILGKALGLDEELCEMLLLATPLHDLGKIAIPDEILLKPGRLNNSEWEIMKTHPEKGGELLSNSGVPLIELAETIARTHHEKWDGSGYPRGLEQNEIPWEGQITAVCDVFDALTSVRPYKDAWPVEQAIAFIEQQGGKHFNPDITSVFSNILPEIFEVKMQFSESDRNFIVQK